MNIKTNLVNAEHQAFIAKCIKRQNKNRFTTVKTVVFQAVSLFAVLAVCILILFLNGVCRHERESIG